MRVLFVFGTRPEIIKLSPVLRACDRLRIPYDILHTGQHYSKELDEVFWRQLKIRTPRLNLHVGSSSHAQQTGAIMTGVEDFLLVRPAQVVVVQGDTNSTLGGGLAAAKLGVPVAHVEAGLRSYDRSMPEETNRVLTDHLSDVLFPPTRGAAKILRSEGIASKKIRVTGNTVVDAVFQNLDIAEALPRQVEERDLLQGSYVLVTAHRQENVDAAPRLRGIIQGLREVQKRAGLEIVFPIHPRTKARLDKWKISVRGFRTTKPLDYFTFLRLERNAALVITDSGGVQEEACILRVPTLTIRDNTERPETVDVGSNLLVGAEPKRIAAAAHVMLSRKRRPWKNPFGDGKAGLRIARTLKERFATPSRVA